MIDKDNNDESTKVIRGRIDEHGRVLIPVIVIASDGLEVEVEASVTVEFVGSIAVSDELAQQLGWRRLGSRKVMIGSQSVVLDHYFGTVALGHEPKQVVVLGGINRPAIIGQKLMSGRVLQLDFSTSEVALTQV
jgi:predicted aspartyl protease